MQVHTIQSVEAWLSDIAEKMASVVDPSFRAGLTAQYLTLLQQWHNVPANQKALLTGDFADAVQKLDEQVSAGLVQYKLEPGLGDLQSDVQQALEQAMGSMTRLKQLVNNQMSLPERRKWEDRLQSIAGQLQRVDDELSYAPHSMAHMSRLNQMANTVNNLVAVEMLPLEIEWSRELGLTPPRFQTSGSARSGAINIQTNPDVWRQGLGSLRLGSGQADDEQAIDALNVYNQAVTEAWQAGSDNVKRQAQVPFELFKTAATKLGALQGRIVKQVEWVTTVGVNNPAKFEGWRATLNERINDYNSAAAEARGLADEMKQVSFNEFDEPEQVVQKMLGGDLPRNSTAVALLYDSQIKLLAQDVDDAWQAADDFDRDAGIRTA